jgi:(E)-4-hydroxy-3-methyl-but-2-enyl pyrophosphate reductase
LRKKTDVRRRRPRSRKRRKNLRVVVSEGVGFCYGVKRAIKMALESALKSDKPVYSLGPLIHNPQVVERLKEKGVKPLTRLRKAGGAGGAVVIRSHGVSPEDADAARRKGYDIIDATCPFVRKAQENARRISDMGYRLVVVGERKHPEVKGILGQVSRGAVVVENVRQAKALKFGERVGIIAQTTVPIDIFSSIVCEIARKAREILVINTICSETAKRQDKARALAARVDAVLVVGGRNSANTSRLATLCTSMCPKTYHIETAEEIESRWFRAGSTVGVVAGASTPKWLVDNIVGRLEQL